MKKGKKIAIALSVLLSAAPMVVPTVTPTISIAAEVTKNGVVDGKLYDNGKLVTGEGVHTVKVDNTNKTYYTDKAGKVLYKWQTNTAGAKYYMGTDGLVRKGENKIGTAYYYFNTSGVMQTGPVTINGAKYLFANDGKKVLNQKFTTVKVKDVDKTYYTDKNGKILYVTTDNIGTFKRIGTVDATTKLAPLYHFNKDGTLTKNAWRVNADGYKYYFGNDGKAVKGNVKINNVECSFNDTNKLQYTVKFVNGNKPITTQTIVYNQKTPFAAKAPANPTKTGYTFTGWDKKFDKVTSNLTVNATWKINQYNVAFNGNGATSGKMDTLKKDCNSNVVLTNKFSKTGHIFSGWNTKADGKGTAYKDNSTFKVPNTNTTLFAQWKAKTITVVFHKNDGGTDETYRETYTYGVKNQTFGQKLTKMADDRFGSWTRKEKDVSYVLTGWQDKDAKTTYNRDSSGKTSVSDSWINSKYDNNKNHEVHVYAVWAKKNAWRTENGKCYYYVNGTPLKGWVQLGKGTKYPDGGKEKHWSFFDKNTGAIYTGWHEMGTKEGEKTKHWSYFGGNGWLRTGWVKLGKGTSEPDGNTTPHWSYFGENGWLRNGLQMMGNGTSNSYGEKTTKHLSYFDDKGWLVTKTNTKVNGTYRTITGKGWLTTVYVDEFGGKANDGVNDATAMMEAIYSTEDINGGITVLLKENGRYNFTQSKINPNTKRYYESVKINKSNVTIKSSGKNKAIVELPQDAKKASATFYVHVGEKTVNGKVYETGKSVVFQGLKFKGTYGNVTYNMIKNDQDEGYNASCILFHSYSSDKAGKVYNTGSIVTGCEFVNTGRRAVGIGSSLHVKPGTKGIKNFPHGKTNDANQIRWVSNVTIENCNFSNNRGITVCTAAGDNIKIRNNKFYNSGLEHITLDWGTRNSLVYKNEFRGYAGGCGIIGADTAVKNKIESNIFVNQTRKDLGWSDYADVRFNDGTGASRENFVQKDTLLTTRIDLFGNVNKSSNRGEIKSGNGTFYKNGTNFRYY